MLVDSPRVLATALDCEAVVDTVLTIDPDMPVVARAAAAGADVAVVDQTTLASVAEAAHPQGVAAAVRLDTARLAAVGPDADGTVTGARFDTARLVVVIDGAGEPGNVGAIVRTAAAVAADAIVTTAGTADPTHPRAVRSSAGALFALPVVADADPDVLFPALGGAGLSVVVADPHGAPRLPAGDRVVLVVGGEAGGPGRAARAAADHVVALPMAPPVESLNVAVTAGVLLYRLAGDLSR